MFQKGLATKEEAEWTITIDMNSKAVIATCESAKMSGRLHMAAARITAQLQSVRSRSRSYRFETVLLTLLVIQT